MPLSVDLASFDLTARNSMVGPKTRNVLFARANIRKCGHYAGNFVQRLPLSTIPFVKHKDIFLLGNYSVNAQVPILGSLSCGVF